MSLPRPLAFTLREVGKGRGPMGSLVCLLACLGVAAIRWGGRESGAGEEAEDASRFLRVKLTQVRWTCTEDSLSQPLRRCLG